MLGSIVSILNAPSAIKLADKIIIFILLILNVKNCLSKFIRAYVI